MYENQQTKVTVEKLTLGSFGLAVTSSSDFWKQESEIQRLLIEISKVCQLMLQQGYVVNIARLFIFTSNFRDEVLRWQQELDMAKGVSNDERGMAIGKAFTWGDGGDYTTYGVIVFNEYLGRELLQQDVKRQNRARQTLIHEFAHVHDGILALSTFGNLTPIQETVFENVCSLMASAIWGEYFAESTAMSCTEGWVEDKSIDFTLKLLQQTITSIRQATNKFHTDKNGLNLWTLVVDELSLMLNQFGRSLGILSTLESKPEITKKFWEDVDKISPKWEVLFRQIAVELESLDHQEWTLQRFNILMKLVEKSFNLMGISPKSIENGVHLDVSFHIADQ